MMENSNIGLRWYEKQLRMQQTVLREIDVINYDVEGVIRYLKDTHANCFVINGGGIVDFFQHDLAISNPNRFMGARDILAEVTRACRAADIKVIVRVDFRGVSKRDYDLHPDWFAMDEHGKSVPWEVFDVPLPEPLFAPCYLGFYRNEHAFAFARELFTRYDIDGIWENAPAQYGVCYCKRCSDGWRAATGSELPRGAEFSNPRYDRYKAWSACNLKTHFENFQAEIKRHGEDKIFCAEIFGLFYEWYKKSSSDLYTVRHAMDFMATPLFVANHEPLQAPATLIKFLQALAPGKTPVMLYGHLGTDNHLRYVSGSPLEVRTWMWQAVSAGGSLWDCTFNGHHPGVTHDRRNAYLGSDIFAWMKEHEAVLHGQQTVAPVSILYLQQSDIRFSNSDRAKDQYFTHILGMEQVLLDEHVQYNFICDVNFSLDALKDTQLLVIPNGAVLREREIEIIRSYVRSGGRLLATYQTSLFDEAGAQRSDFGLADVFGCHYTGVLKDASRWGYQRVQPGHPLTAGLENTEVVANWGNTLLVRRHDDAVYAPLSFVPPIYPQPPERAWLPTLETDYPTALVNRYGDGECVYFSSPIDRNALYHGHLDFTHLLGNALRHLLAGTNPFSTNAPPSLQISLGRVKSTTDTYLLHAINLTSAPRRPIAALVPVKGVEVQLRLPGSRLKSATVLRSEGQGSRASTVGASEGFVTVNVAMSEVHEYTVLQMEVE